MLNLSSILLEIPPTQDRGTWIALIVGILAVVYLMMRPKFRKSDPLARPMFSSLSQQRSVERQMQNLLVELSEMARQVSGQLDTRAAKLQVLIDEADRKIAQLQGTPPPTGEAPALRLAGEHAPSATPTPPADPRHAPVYELADQGLDAREIASRLDRPSGEVELILALRRKVG